MQQGLALQEILPQPTRTIASADDRDADPRTYDFRDGTAERNAPRTKSRSTLTNRLSRDGTLATLRQNGGKDLRLVISTRSNDAATTLKMKTSARTGNWR